MRKGFADLDHHEGFGPQGLNTTEIYIRDADTIQGGFGEPFPALPAVVVDPFETFARLMPVAKVATPIWLKTRGSERGGRDSKRRTETPQTEGIWL
jgi:hypothetical protein